MASALVDRLAAPASTDDRHPMPWDVVDLRRLRCGDPAGDELAGAFGAREMSDGWTLNVERPRQRRTIVQWHRVSTLGEADRS